MSALRFTKMQGAGNDFVILDRIAGAPFPDAALARRLADRHFGVGCDQLMVIETAPAGGYAYRIVNADGSGRPEAVAHMCACEKVNEPATDVAACETELEAALAGASGEACVACINKNAGGSATDAT